MRFFLNQLYSIWKARIWRLSFDFCPQRGGIVQKSDIAKPKFQKFYVGSYRSEIMEHFEDWSFLRKLIIVNSSLSRWTGLQMIITNRISKARVHTRWIKRAQLLRLSWSGGLIRAWEAHRLRWSWYLIPRLGLDLLTESIQGWFSFFGDSRSLRRGKDFLTLDCVSAFTLSRRLCCVNLSVVVVFSDYLTPTSYWCLLKKMKRRLRREVGVPECCNFSTWRGVHWIW